MTANPMAWEGSVNPKVASLSLSCTFNFFLCFRFRKIVPCTNDVFNRIVRFINLYYGQVKIFEQAQNCLLPMGITSENVAHRFGVSRKEQDQAAVS